MGLNNSQLHGVAFVGTIVLGGTLFVTTLYLSQAIAVTTAAPPPLQEMMTIEASLARKSEKKKQPQKELKAPELVKPEGVSRDETKPPIEKKPEEPKRAKPTDEPIDLSKFRRPTDDDVQPGAEPTTDIGQFDGSKKGFAPINAGDPYWREFNADFRQVWEIPTISKVDGVAVGCFHIRPDGTIADTKFETPSGDEILDDSVQRAMKVIQKARNDKPQPVPTEQLGVIRQWLCFRFKPNP